MMAPTPNIQVDGTQYAAYFESERGAQLVFVFDRQKSEGHLWHSAIASVKPQPVVEGRVNEISLSDLEQVWLSFCWKVAILGQSSSNNPLKQSVSTENSEVAA